jgi:zinc/manganese transport system ATP-binding protein
VAYLPQDVAIDRDFPITVADMIALGFQRKLGLFGAMGAADQQRLKGAIEAVGLSGLDQRPIGELSGGQFQRTVFARVIAQDAPIILLDEPFSAQDARTTADLMRLIRRWTEEGRTLVLVLHDIEMARALCAQTLVLAREAIVWGPTPAALTPETLARATALAEGWTPEAVA